MATAAHPIHSGNVRSADHLISAMPQVFQFFLNGTICDFWFDPSSPFSFVGSRLAYACSSTSLQNNACFNLCSFPLIGYCELSISLPNTSQFSQSFFVTSTPLISYRSGIIGRDFITAMLLHSKPSHSSPFSNPKQDNGEQSSKFS